jgi:hypothetical protein
MKKAAVVSQGGFSSNYLQFAFSGPSSSSADL